MRQFNHGVHGGFTERKRRVLDGWSLEWFYLIGQMIRIGVLPLKETKKKHLKMRLFYIFYFDDFHFGFVTLRWWLKFLNRQIVAKIFYSIAKRDSFATSSFILLVNKDTVTGSSNIVLLPNSSFNHCIIGRMSGNTFIIEIGWKTVLWKYSFFTKELIYKKQLGFTLFVIKFIKKNYKLLF